MNRPMETKKPPEVKPWVRRVVEASGVFMPEGFIREVGAKKWNHRNLSGHLWSGHFKGGGRVETLGVEKWESNVSTLNVST